MCQSDVRYRFQKFQSRSDVVPPREGCDSHVNFVKTQNLYHEYKALKSVKRSMGFMKTGRKCFKPVMMYMKRS